MDRQDFEIEKDMLKGNIARICISDDIEEIRSMRNWAIIRLEAMVGYRVEQLSKED